MRELHAVYATCTTAAGERVTFRVGQPTTWERAQARWDRLDVWRWSRVVGLRRRSSPLPRARGLRVRWMRRWYVADFVEVRAVDRHGRGLGSERHAHALVVPYRAAARV